MKRLCTFFVLCIILLTACTSAPLEPTKVVGAVAEPPTKAISVTLSSLLLDTHTNTPKPTETATPTPTPTETPSATATEVQFEPLTLQTEAKDPANYTEITLDDIKSGRVAYLERQAYDQGQLPQFTDKAQFVDLQIVGSHLSLMGLDITTVDVSDTLPSGMSSRHPDTLPMRYVTYYQMKTDSGDEIWVEGLEVLNKDRSVSFLHMGFDPKVWGVGSYFTRYLEDISEVKMSPGILIGTNKCEVNSTPFAALFFLMFTKVCNLYDSNWGLEKEAGTLENWVATGKAMPEMEKVIYVPYLGADW